MSTVDTSTWSPDTDRNNEIVGVSLSADASVSQTWLAIRALMAALKGDTGAMQALMVPFTGATSQADGISGFVPAPEAGDEDKVLKGDGTWGTLPVATQSSAGLMSATDKTYLDSLASVISALDARITALEE